MPLVGVFTDQLAHVCDPVVNFQNFFLSSVSRLWDAASFMRRPGRGSAKNWEGFPVPSGLPTFPFSQQCLPPRGLRFFVLLLFLSSVSRLGDAASFMRRPRRGSAKNPRAVTSSDLTHEFFLSSVSRLGGSVFLCCF